MCTNHLGQPSGEGFADFVSGENREFALLRNRQTIGTRWIKVLATQNSEFQAVRARAQQLKAQEEAEPKAFILRLRGLPFQSKEVCFLFRIPMCLLQWQGLFCFLNHRTL